MIPDVVEENKILRELVRNEKVKAQQERLLELACTRARESLLNDAASAARIRELAALVADRKLDPFTAAEEVIGMRSGCGTTTDE